MDSKIYDILEERASAAIEENGDENLKTGIGNALIEDLYHNAILDMEVVYDFAEHYGVSIDWLLGRSEVESVFG